MRPKLSVRGMSVRGIKNFLGLLFIPLTLIPLTLPAANPFQQNLAWTPSPTTNISTYALYVATNPPPATNWTRVVVTNLSWGSNLLASITNGFPKSAFTPGVTNYLTLTALDTSGVESEPSNVLAYFPPKAPGQFRFTVQYAPAVEGPWQNVPDLPPFELPLTEPVLFTRLKLQ